MAISQLDQALVGLLIGSILSFVILAISAIPRKDH